MKRTLTILGVILVLVIAGARVFMSRYQAGTSLTGNGYSAKNGPYHRIISLSPGITETLFALGAGDRVVGVTRFCRYPPEARQKADVGGFADPNYEAIAALKPDIVLLLAVHDDVVRYLRELKIPYVTVRNEQVRDILDAIVTVGKVSGSEIRARELVEDISGRMEEIARKTEKTDRPRVLISIGRSPGSGSLGEVYVAGHHTFYDELITCAGGANAYSGYDIPYPALSAEGLMVLNPEIIIDLIPDLKERGLDEVDVRREWALITGIDAVKNGRIHVISADYAVIPGPRFILFLEDLARIFHPELFN